jgi:hypothetical protein
MLVGRSAWELSGKTVYSSAFINPRSFSMGVILGSRPGQALYIAAGSSVLPRDRTMCRRRSPLARVKPPLSRTVQDRFGDELTP